MRTKIGLSTDAADGDAVIADLLALMSEQRVDYTAGLRSLSSAVRGDIESARSQFTEPEAFDAWATRWSDRLGDDRPAIAAAMDRVNPIYIPRNHIVEEVLTAASWGDVASFEAFLDLLVHPFDQRAGAERFARPAGADTAEAYQTFCGT
jgi:uncharacterized protein YdiU (UPF0061 family)